MTEQEVKKEIGIENWETFLQWMRGQTVGGIPDDKGGYIADYYEWDVKAFKTKLLTGYDRQNNPITFD